MHPSDEIRGVKSKKLFNKRIVLGVTGSIAAVETIKLSRELIRHGAEVIPVMSKSASKIIHPDSLEFATGNKPIIELTGKTEHVYFCGKVKKPVDLLLISPCTANTISKIIHGIDDTSVTTFTSTAIGSRIPILIVPAMHISMYDHEIIQENIEKCKKMGISIVDPLIIRNKAKMAGIDEIVSHVFRSIDKKDFTGKKILIIGGSTCEPIDDVRIITNRSSGKTAIWLVKNAFFRGADVELWYGHGYEKAPKYIKTDRFDTFSSLMMLFKKSDLKKFDVIILCAAIANYLPEHINGKIKSGKEKLMIELTPSPKLISILREKTSTAIIVGFKIEEGKKSLLDKSYDLLIKNNLDFVVANTIAGFGSNENEIWIIDKNKKSFRRKGNKEILTNNILDIIIQKGK